MCDTNPLNGRAICTCPAGFVGGACNQDMDECSIGKIANFLPTFLSDVVKCFLSGIKLSAFHVPFLCLYQQVQTHVSILENV